MGEELISGTNHFPMAGVLPIVFGMEKRPQGHGYTELEVVGENPFFQFGTRLRGHEFHYSRILSWNRGHEACAEQFVYKLKSGTGVGNKRDGVCVRNILAGYTHLHALGTPQWAAGMVESAGNYRLEMARLVIPGQALQKEFTGTVFKLD